MTTDHGVRPQYKSMVLNIRCPAKVNLFLAVGPKDRRNYHPLRTIFQAIDLCDHIKIELGSGNHSVVFDDPTIPAENTVTKALRLLNEVISLPPLLITIQKQIPPESGFGGGSSNAAAIIRAAQRIARVTIPTGELDGIAQAVGMDVPFFLVGGRAKGERYGDKVQPLPDEPTQWFVIARPNVGSSTPEAYRRLDDLSFDWQDFPESDRLYNDFERVAQVESLSLMSQLKVLGASDVALSGSGSAVFGRFQSRQIALETTEKMTQNYAPSVWTARSLSRAESLEID